MSRSNAFQREYDAIVVGARCAGAATAMLLARQGLSVLAIDRQAYGSDMLSTHALMRAAVLQLARWDVLGGIAEAGTPAVRKTTFHYGAETVAIDIKPDYGVDALYAPRRTVIDRVLVDGARRAGVDMRHGVALADLSFGVDGCVTGAAVREQDGSVHRIRAGIVIGADGRQSTVARIVGAQEYRRSKHCSATIYGYFEGLRHDGYHWHYDRGVAAGAIPTNDGASCVFAGMPNERFRAEMSAGADCLFGRVLAEAAPGFARDVGGARLVGRLRGFPGQAGFFRQCHGAGWALVGDAAYFKDPLTAHGISDALRDAELLARAICRSGPTALARYQAERDALSDTLFAVTDQIASFDWDLDALKALHQTLNKAMKAETAKLAALEPQARLAA